MHDSYEAVLGAGCAYGKRMRAVSPHPQKSPVFQAVVCKVGGHERAQAQHPRFEVVVVRDRDANFTHGAYNGDLLPLRDFCARTESPEYFRL